MTLDTQTNQETKQDTQETNEDTNINSNDINLDDINVNNINPDDINKIINGLNLGGNNLESLIQNFSKGKIGSVLKNFGDIISNNDDEKNNEDNDLNFDISNDNLDIEDECTNEDFELDLDKYFISSEGKNICEALLDITSELKTFNKNFAKHHNLD